MRLPIQKKSWTLEQQKHTISTLETTIIPSHLGSERENHMTARKSLQGTRSFASYIFCLAFSLGSMSALAASDSNDGSSALPAWLTSRQVSNAFHTSGPNAPAREAATLHGPIMDRNVAVYPNEFRTIDGSKNAIGDLGIGGG